MKNVATFGPFRKTETTLSSLQSNAFAQYNRLFYSVKSTILLSKKDFFTERERRFRSSKTIHSSRESIHSPLQSE